MMKAMVFNGVDKSLFLREIPIPNPLPDQVLIKVSACGVCRTDLHIIDGELSTPKLPLVMGHQIVGIVIETGTKVDPKIIGSRVGVPWLGKTMTTPKAQSLTSPPVSSTSKILTKSDSIEKFNSIKSASALGAFTNKIAQYLGITTKKTNQINYKSFSSFVKDKEIFFIKKFENDRVKGFTLIADLGLINKIHFKLTPTREGFKVYINGNQTIKYKIWETEQAKTQFKNIAEIQTVLGKDLKKIKANKDGSVTFSTYYRNMKISLSKEGKIYLDENFLNHNNQLFHCYLPENKTNSDIVYGFINASKEKHDHCLELFNKVAIQNIQALDIVSKIEVGNPSNEDGTHNLEKSKIETFIISPETYEYHLSHGNVNFEGDVDGPLSK